MYNPLLRFLKPTWNLQGICGQTPHTRLEGGVCLWDMLGKQVQRKHHRRDPPGWELWTAHEVNRAAI